MESLVSSWNTPCIKHWMHCFDFYISSLFKCKSIASMARPAFLGTTGNLQDCAAELSKGHSPAFPQPPTMCLMVAVLYKCMTVLHALPKSGSQHLCPTLVGRAGLSPLTRKSQMQAGFSTQTQWNQLAKILMCPGNCYYRYLVKVRNGL